VEYKIITWQIADVAKVNDCFDREEVIINAWEDDQVKKSSNWLNKYKVQKPLSPPIFFPINSMPSI
jgi:hypothetical protein